MLYAQLVLFYGISLESLNPGLLEPSMFPSVRTGDKGDTCSET